MNGRIYMDTVALISMVAFFGVLIILVIIREKSGTRFEIKNTDLMLALIVPVFILFVSGKIDSFEFGDLKVQAAIVKASETKVKTQINILETGVPIEAVKKHAKRGVKEIPRLVKAKTEVLTFELGQGNYYGPAIKKYIEELGKTQHFKYLLITERDGSFWGLSDATRFVAPQQGYVADITPQQLAHWLNSGNQSKLRQLPGFISKEYSISQSMNKSDVLTKMEQLHVEQLPAVDDNGKFIGVVDRSRVLASMMLEITSKLRKD